jgi:hypothetical protein
MFYFFEDLWDFLRLVWYALRETRFPWLGFFMVIAFLIVSLAVVEWSCGNTMVKYPTEQGTVTQWSWRYKLIDDKEKSSTWREVISHDKMQVTDLIFQACYVTTISMTTIGFGDFVPSTPLARLITVVDGIMGIILLGVVVSALSARLGGMSFRLDSALSEEVTKLAAKWNIPWMDVLRRLVKEALEKTD